MVNFCVATSSEEMVPPDIAFLKDYLKAEKVVVLGSFGVQFEVEKKLIATGIELPNGKQIDLNFLSEEDRCVHLLVADMDGTILEEECIDEIAVESEKLRVNPFADLLEKIMSIFKRTT